MRFMPVSLAICTFAASGCGTFSDIMCGPATVVIDEPSKSAGSPSQANSTDASAESSGSVHRPGSATHFAGPVFYRGVRFGVEAAKEGGAMVLMVADIPFSAVADTLLASYLAIRFLTDAASPSGSEVKTNTEKNSVNPLPQAAPGQ